MLTKVIIITTTKNIIETENKAVEYDSRRNIILYNNYMYIINTLRVCNPRTILIIKSYYCRKNIQ